MNTGRAFVKKIGPFGSALFLMMFVAFLLVCFLPPRTPTDKYLAPHDSEYYAQSDETLEELKTELENNFFPLLDLEPILVVSDGRLVIALTGDDSYTAYVALDKHFDMELFAFVMSADTAEAD